MNQQPIIVLLTDFGTSDAYVGTMKGVMLGICPEAQLVDLTHEIDPQNVRQAAYVLLTAYRYFPPDTVFLVVVDPGVGTARTPIAVATDHGTYIAPDNGVLSYVTAEVEVRGKVTLANRQYRLPEISQTFHGRDVFSPAAAHLACGVPLEELGPPQPDIVELRAPRLAIEPHKIRGEVLHVDRFGNVITSIGRLTWLDAATLRLEPAFGDPRPAPRTLDARACSVALGDRTLETIHTTYGAVAPETPTLLVGSTGQLEIGINQGSAARTFGLALGDPVILLIAD